MAVCEFCGREIPAGRKKYCGTMCMNREDARRKRERRLALRMLPEQCRYNTGVDCPDRGGCAGCGWKPEVAAARLARLRG